MKKVCLLLMMLVMVSMLHAQGISSRLSKAYTQFENDSQLSNALISLYVVDGKTGQVIFDKNSKTGMAPASTQKIITSATAFALLGKEYCYKTTFYNAINKSNPSQNNLLAIGSGDPTLGSWRYNSTHDTVILKKIAENAEKKNIKQFTGSLFVNNMDLENNGIPEGYIWQDIGNYYGAGHFAFNWHENQYDISFKTGSDGAAEIKNIQPALPAVVFSNQVMAGKKGSGDNAYIYFVPATKGILLKGTVPPSQTAFTISGAIPDPSPVFATQLQQYLAMRKMPITIKEGYHEKTFSENEMTIADPEKYKLEEIYTHYSPALDSIVYWYLKKSINLYGEALIKTLAFEKNGIANTGKGAAIIREFWKQNGINENELNIYDGSGLSPANRITTHSQVEVLKFAKKQSWFPAYITAFPEYNNMKMKSGTISDVKAFTGYHTARDGKAYIFAFIVNNYNGSSSSLVQKMYRVLDVLK